MNEVASVLCAHRRSHPSSLAARGDDARFVTCAPEAWDGEPLVQDPTSRFTLLMAHDQRVTGPGVPRPVVLKLVAPPYASRQRELIAAQVQVLRCARTNLLPAVLDLIELDREGRAHPAEAHCASGLALEAMPGRSLRKVIDEERPWSLQRRLVFAREVGSWLALMLRRGLCSFDCSPWHIRVLDDGSPAFVGIGSLCPVDAYGRPEPRHVNFRATRRGSAPPEAYGPQACQLSADRLAVWSVQALLMHLLLWKADLPSEVFAGTSTIDRHSVGAVLVPRARHISERRRKLQRWLVRTWDAIDLPMLLARLDEQGAAR
ncbi:MAG: hypothetical protein RMM29_09585 [Planctomycetota bacterium]|nr:hypothetical protein [Planctomycetota bacterium]MCX8003953.1 hypothetical protein [Burkholderiaceae bacterium]MDW8373881.1 hypothetical protein [Planctomycetota bacterium]